MKFYRIVFISIFAFLSSDSFIESSICPEFVTIYVHGAQEWWLKATLSKDLWYCPLNLHPVSELLDSSLIKQDAKRIAALDPCLFSFEHYYTFGWAGNLSFQVRKNEGERLFQETQKLLLEYQQKYGMMPKIRFIGFSHGCNVVLNAINCLPYFSDCSIYTEIILLVCPVQKPTEAYIENSYINRAYVLCADNDYVQTMDWYKHEGSWYLPRKFFQIKNQSKIVQYSIFVNNKPLSHTDFMHAFMLHIPLIRKKSELYFNDNLKFENSECVQKMIDFAGIEYFKINIFDEKYIYYSLLNSAGLYGVRYE